MPKSDDWLYMGDGVYAKYDGFSIWLRTGSHIEPTNEICLEPSVINSLNIFYNIHRTAKEKPQGE